MDSDEIAVASVPRSSPPFHKPEDALPNSKPAANNLPKLDTTVAPVSFPSGPPTKKARMSANGESANDFTQPANKDDSLRNDLRDFGLTTRDIKDMMSKKEPAWDPATPSHLLLEERAAQEGREKRERGKKNGNYEPLFLTEGSNWALFDPNKGFPAPFGEVPSSFDRFTTYKPGNARILEYNIHTQSVRVKCAPAFLKDGSKTIEYTKSGLRIVEVVAKRPRGRPRKHPLPVDGVANVGIKIDRAVGEKARPVGRPRKVDVEVPESPESQSSDGRSLTDFEELEEVEMGPEVAVKEEVFQVGENNGECTA